ncbi:TIGR04255 family protein [Streptomyces sp. NPDC091280]|uniref:TIGR04255 family protein n=1 Tax=Streptomyces sp. NPDC091280 TaxID=3365984 RepID=UPI0037F6E131
MSDSEHSTPFPSEPTPEVRLQRAPLVKVIAQARFPQLASMAGGDIEKTFARAMATDFPLAQQGQSFNVVLSPQGVTQEPTNVTTLQLRTIDESWIVTLTPGSLAIETTSYPGRNAFCSRFLKALQKFTELAGPPYFERLGIRYVNRISDPNLLQILDELVRPEVLGTAITPLPDGFNLSHCLSDNAFNWQGGGLQAKWGKLPPDVHLDVALPTVHTSNWLLDLDSFSTGRLDPSTSNQTLNNLAGRAYDFFRWSVTDKFLDTFGRE